MRKGFACKVAIPPGATVALLNEVATSLRTEDLVSEVHRETFEIWVLCEIHDRHLSRCPHRGTHDWARGYLFALAEMSIENLTLDLPGDWARSPWVLVESEHADEGLWKKARRALTLVEDPGA